LAYCVYILRSLADASLYIGQTNDLARRLAQHNNGAGRSYTAGRGPWKLVYQELHQTRSEAMARERFLK